jgi:hypothetical protein
VLQLLSQVGGRTGKSDWRNAEACSRIVSRLEFLRKTRLAKHDVLKESNESTPVAGSARKVADRHGRIV